ncbi:FkbM family methyltransferase [Beijerinckia sp. L45]|uniref:FkbM family methyltransferase n=1 Tax=Beijerinckia sp. L45 TaxID=1641855 RepID=UPI00131C9D89|nr:FkbM family methyltransferase [Beijerinckia sp. L45]
MAKMHTRFGIVPDYEQILEQNYSKLLREGDCVLDIGAHIGRHTRKFSELVGASGKVHAFEPLPYAFERLNVHKILQNVMLYNIAVSDTNGTASFVFADGAPEESGFREKTYNNPLQTVPTIIQVQKTTLDSLSDKIGKVDFVKIDVEGAEIACLEGAKRIIAANRPVITVEYGRPSYSAYDNTASSLFRVAQDMGYVIGDMFGSYCLELQIWERACDVSYWDWFLVPVEKIETWAAAFRS